MDLIVLICAKMFGYVAVHGCYEDECEKMKIFVRDKIVMETRVGLIELSSSTHLFI
jgi:hypothetical protein